MQKLNLDKKLVKIAVLGVFVVLSVFLIFIMMGTKPEAHSINESLTSGTDYIRSLSYDKKENRIILGANIDTENYANGGTDNSSGETGGNNPSDNTKDPKKNKKVASNTDKSKNKTISTKKINAISVSRLKLGRKTAKIYKGSTYKLKAAVFPAKARNKKLNWSTQDASIATVSPDGVIRGNKVGKTVITAITDDGSEKKASCTVTVVARKVSSMELNVDFAEVYVGKTVKISARVYPKNATNRRVSWSSANPDVATVSKKGLVKAKNRGRVLITAVTKDGTNISRNCVIRVK